MGRGGRLRLVLVVRALPPAIVPPRQLSPPLSPHDLSGTMEEEGRSLIHENLNPTGEKHESEGEKNASRADCSVPTRRSVNRRRIFSQCQSQQCHVEVEILLDTTRHVVIEEIPVIRFDAALGVQHYTNVMQKRDDRALVIGPATFYGSAITPTENPQNQRVDPKTKEKVKHSGASHHIIQMCYSSQKKDPTLAVQLLVNDANGYITAKRVRKHNVWGGWQQFADIDGVEVPEFLSS